MCNKNFKFPISNFKWEIVKEKGQTLMELVVVVAVSAIVVGALVFATIASLRNASFSKNQAQATKLAQEGIERVRAGRNKSSPFYSFSMGGVAVDSWKNSALWSNQISARFTPPKDAYFRVSDDGSLTWFIDDTTFPESSAEAIPPISPIFRRAVILSDEVANENYKKQKTVTVIVSWTDFSGSHKSELTTILRKL